MYEVLEPIIERRLEANPMRCELADDICAYIKHEPQASAERFYAACETLLKDRDTERIMLYLPFWVLEKAPDSFRKAYLEVWFRMLRVKDVRENFHHGDCFELDARPVGGLERVVKCAHLTPWLLKFGYLEPWQVFSVLDSNQKEVLLLSSFRDTWMYTYVKNILGSSDMRKLNDLTKHLPDRVKQEPLYVSDKRKKWLAEQEQHLEPLIPDAKLEGPFSENIPYFESQLEEIARHLYAKEIILVGGSKLKGYGSKKSDLDSWRLGRLKQAKDFAPGSPDAIHIYFNTLWLGKLGAISGMIAATKDVEKIYSELTGEYRRMALERLESDLLLYRLLHKGYNVVKGETKSSAFVEMDGDCPFYDDGYREIATMLFAKYVWL